MKVLVVGPQPPPNGGMALQTAVLIEQLRREQVTVEFLPNNPPYCPSIVAYLPVLRALFRFIPYCIRLWRACGRNDVVHILANSGTAWRVFAVPALRIAHWRGKHIVLNYRGGLAREFFAMHWARVWRSLQYADHVVVPTRFLQEVFAQYHVPAKIVPNIIDLAAFARSKPLSDALHIVVTRNLEPLYDNESALRALALLRTKFPEARMSIAGEGPERARLQNLARQLQIADAVHFVGRLSTPNLVKLLHNARIVLNPSTADNSPNSLIEAMAAGIPIVSTNVGGIPYLCEANVHALLVPAQKPQAMADAIVAIHQNEQRRQLLIENGLRRAAEFSWAHVWASLSPCYAAEPK